MPASRGLFYSRASLGPSLSTDPACVSLSRVAAWLGTGIDLPAKDQP